MGREHWNEWSDAPGILGMGGATAAGTTALDLLFQAMRRRSRERGLHLNWPLGATTGVLASVMAAIALANKRHRDHYADYLRDSPVAEMLPPPYEGIP